MLLSTRKGEIRRGVLAEDSLTKNLIASRKLTVTYLNRTSSVETQIEDIDIKENTKHKIKFRKVPYSAWVMSFIFFAGAALVAWFIHIEVI